MAGVTWRKSSHSGSNAEQCVEVAVVEEGAGWYAGRTWWSRLIRGRT
ncbi:DUF397 domain-containing protein [Actinoallomurus soli]|nr:DUF397 domain-containing protein [Actinoallomurus soli]MCO5967687.1 DUF397 domain-containing protein [Actinoallomurus soli]